MVLKSMKEAGADFIESRARATRYPETLQQVVLRPQELAEPHFPDGYWDSRGLRPHFDSITGLKLRRCNTPAFSRPPRVAARGFSVPP